MTVKMRIEIGSQDRWHHYTALQNQMATDVDACCPSLVAVHEINKYSQMLCSLAQIPLTQEVAHIHKTWCMQLSLMREASTHPDWNGSQKNKQLKPCHPP